MDNYCNQCGFETDIFIEGVCEECFKYNQEKLDEFNARYDWWESLNSYERDEVIKKSWRNY